jgi:hypothetical protein
MNHQHECTGPPADVGMHWHERFERDAGNRWLREGLVELFSVDR